MKFIKSGIVVFLLSVCGSAYADDGNWIVSYEQSSATASNEFISGSNGTTAVLKEAGGGASSVSISNYSVEYRFLPHLAALYHYESGPMSFGIAYPFPSGGSTFTRSNDGSYGASGLAVEAYTTLLPSGTWLEGFVRLNTLSYTLNGSSQVSNASSTGLIPVSESISGTQTFLSLGVRVKVAPHFGLSLTQNRYSSFFSPATSLGLYFQF